MWFTWFTCGFGYTPLYLDVYRMYRMCSRFTDVVNTRGILQACSILSICNYTSCIHVLLYCCMYLCMCYVCYICAMVSVVYLGICNYTSCILVLLYCCMYVCMCYVCYICAMVSVVYSVLYVCVCVRVRSPSVVEL